MRDYDALGIKYFNPQVKDWDPSMAVKEADHMANDCIVVWPITSETPGLGSIAETGFSLLQAIRLESRRDFVILVDQFIDESVKESFSPDVIKESLRGRALISQHLLKLKLDNVYVVQALPQMLDVSKGLWTISVLRQEIKDSLKERA